MMQIPFCFLVCKAWKSGFKIRKMNERMCLKCLCNNLCLDMKYNYGTVSMCKWQTGLHVCIKHTDMQIYLHSKRHSNKASHFHVEMLLALCIQNIWGFSLLQFIGEFSMWVSSPFKCSKQICFGNIWTIHLNDSVKYYAETI